MEMEIFNGGNHGWRKTKSKDFKILYQDSQRRSDEQLKESWNEKTPERKKKNTKKEAKKQKEALLLHSEGEKNSLNKAPFFLQLFSFKTKEVEKETSTKTPKKKQKEKKSQERKKEYQKKRNHRLEGSLRTEGKQKVRDKTVTRKQTKKILLPRLCLNCARFVNFSPLGALLFWFLSLCALEFILRSN